MARRGTARRGTARRGCALLALVAAISVSPVALADTWFEYFRVGAALPGGTVWLSHELDTDSIAGDGENIRYRIRVVHPEKGFINPAVVRANCANKTRGQLPDMAMHSVAQGTLGGQELAMACALAGGRGLLR